MSRAARISNLLAVVIPFVAFLAAIVLFWGNGVGAHDLVFFAVMYLLTGFGVTIGFHRLLTHRSFATSKPVEYLFAILGSMSVQGPVISWVSDHRKHHAHADEEGDPHSPHVGGGTGLRGLIHAHMGWLISEQGLSRKRKYAADLMDDTGMRKINKAFPWIVVAGLAAPALAGYLDHRADHRRAHRPALGRPRARVLHPPRDLVDQLRLPLPGAPALRRRGSLDQRLLARASPPSARRGTTTITPSRARPSTAWAAASSIRRPASSARWRSSAWCGTSCASRPSARRRS